MTSKASRIQRTAPLDTDADIDRFLIQNHDDVAAKLAAARQQIAEGQAAPIEPLEALLRDARAAR